MTHRLLLIGQIDFGDAVVVKPDGQDGARLVAIFASEWPSR